MSSAGWPTLGSVMGIGKAIISKSPEMARALKPRPSHSFNFGASAPKPSDDLWLVAQGRAVVHWALGQVLAFGNYQRFSGIG